MTLGERLGVCAKAVNGGRTAIAKALGIHRNTYSRWEKGGGAPSDEQMRIIAAMSGRGFRWLKTGQDETPFAAAGRDLVANRGDDVAFEDDFGRAMRRYSIAAGFDPNVVGVVGTAAGALAGSLALSGQVIEQVQRPAGLAASPDAYALRVRGHSMEPRYFPGDLVFVDPARAYAAGDVVVIQTQDHDGAEPLAWLKLFVRRDGMAIHARQYQGDVRHEFRLPTVRAVHRVLTNNELFGL